MWLTSLTRPEKLKQSQVYINLKILATEMAITSLLEYTVAVVDFWVFFRKAPQTSYRYYLKHKNSSRLVTSESTLYM
jgi:hypothetical protein